MDYVDKEPDTPFENRPLILTIVCILGFAITMVEIFAVLFVHELRVELIRLHGHALPIATTIIDALAFIGFIGIWRMKLWGVILFALSMIAIPFYSLFAGMSYSINYYPAIIVLVICLFYVRRMDR